MANTRQLVTPCGIRKINPQSLHRFSFLTYRMSTIKGIFRYLIYIKLPRRIHVIQEEHVARMRFLYFPILYMRHTPSPPSKWWPTPYFGHYQGRNKRMALLEDSHIGNNVRHGPNGDRGKSLPKGVARNPGRSGTTIWLVSTSTSIAALQIKLENWRLATLSEWLLNNDYSIIVIPVLPYPR